MDRSISISFFQINERLFQSKSKSDNTLLYIPYGWKEKSINGFLCNLENNQNNHTSDIQNERSS